MRAKFKAMMKYCKFFGVLIIFSAFIISCNSDDDTSISLRDEEEVYIENAEDIEEYLSTHFFELVPASGDNPLTQEIVIDTIAGENADRTSIMESDDLKMKEVTQGEITYELYYIQVRKGAEESYQPTKADRVIITYAGENFNGNEFDGSNLPVSFNILGSQGPGLISGFSEALIEFKGASGFEENEDGSVSYNDDFGMGVVFVPAGLAYFNGYPSEYEPIMFKFKMLAAIQMDHDGDGIPSYMEDIDNDGIYFEQDEDIDGDGVPNYLDPDDDGDGVLTIDEIEVNDVNGDGIITEDEIIFTDTNNDGTPDYLDPDIAIQQ